MIENPYAPYAGQAVVGNPEMFFGRERLIEDIAGALRKSQNRCVLVYGRYRSGKSTVLYHLERLLQEDKDLLILGLGNIALLGDTNSNVPIWDQILFGILRELEYAIKDRVDEGFPALRLSIPNANELFNHPAPLQFFETLLKELKQAFKQAGWGDARVVLLIDNFEYIYHLIVDGKLDASFMQSWQALLQANHFSAVLAGSDVIPKLIDCFPNEFSTTQVEHITYLNSDDARRLIDEPIRIGGKHGKSRYQGRAIERILDLTAGSPFYIQIICHRLVEYMNMRLAELVTEADVEQVKNELIHGVSALELDKFHNLINSRDTSADAISGEDALKILKTIADNSRTSWCHRDRIVCKTSSSIDTILDDLEKRDVVERREQSYKIQVELFKEWLIANG